MARQTRQAPSRPNRSIWGRSRPIRHHSGQTVFSLGFKFDDYVLHAPGGSSHSCLACVFEWSVAWLIKVEDQLLRYELPMVREVDACCWVRKLAARPRFLRGVGSATLMPRVIALCLRGYDRSFVLLSSPL